MSFQKVDMGWNYENSDIFLFFGNRTANLERVQTEFGKYSFAHIHQVHGNSVVRAKLDNVEMADAHWTTEKHLALCVQTADCMPIFIYSPQTRKVVGIHAGWRGLASRIVPHAIQTAFNKHLTDLQVFVGPHILSSSFEVDQSVAEQIISSSGVDLNNPDAPLLTAKNDKFYVNLYAVLLCQLGEIGISPRQCHLLEIDTKTQPELNSYRRDRDLAGRQISFIALK